MAENYLIIKDGEVQMITETVQKKASVEKWLEKIGQSMPFKSPFLPQGCFQVIQNRETDIYVIEIPPNRRQLPYQTGPFNGKFQILIPYLYVFFLCDKQGKPYARPYWMMSPTDIRETKQLLFSPWFPNTDKGGLICTGSQNIDYHRWHRLVFADIIAHLYSAPFNTDIPHNSTLAMIDWLLNKCTELGKPFPLASEVEIGAEAEKIQEEITAGKATEETFEKRTRLKMCGWDFSARRMGTPYVYEKVWVLIEYMTLQNMTMAQIYSGMPFAMSYSYEKYIEMLKGENN